MQGLQQREPARLGEHGEEARDHPKLGWAHFLPPGG